MTTNTSMIIASPFFFLFFIQLTRAVVVYVRVQI